mgnify:CR=1 FL=1
MISIAHRGFAGLYPENTMLSFEKALEFSPDMLETDVQLSSDGEVVIMHDESLERMTGVKAYVKDMTFTELRELNAASGYPELPPQKIPTLWEYLAFTKERGIKTFLELKNSFFTYDGMESKVLALLDEFDMRGDVIVYSANHFSAYSFRAMAPDVEISFPFDNWIIGYGDYCRRYSVKSCVPYYLSVNETTADEIHRHGVKLYPWTVDDPDDMRRMMDIGVDGLMTNRIDLLKQTMAQENE